MTPEISIIIPVYNAQDFLGDAINSVINQSFTNWELIIIDDGSKDQSSCIANMYKENDSRIKLHIQPNQGVASARNKGTQLSNPHSKYILFLDNDDFLETDALDTLRAVLEEHPEATAACGLPREVNRQGGIINPDLALAQGNIRYEIQQNKLVQISDDRDITFNSLVVWPCVQTPGQVLINRSFLDLVGNFDSATVPSDDWDLLIRLSLLGGIKYIRRFTINKRSHDRNISSKGRLMKVAEPIIRHKLANTTLLSKDKRNIARQGHYYSCLVKLTWVTADIRQRNYYNAVRGTLRAAKSLVRFLQTPYR
ncbi:MAG: glycosyltransferase family 2 protein [Chloroflexales bacterium]|nr:glycosyltransferase family 2 protein [Chloroflexales bacterium]